ncbi:hypothetical protein C8F01DRAFT_388194 [Mycena amicta]|nr:hypothetical protein C8F01DRAFT_388194 [Mycena amicta]
MHLLPSVGISTDLTPAPVHFLRQDLWVCASLKPEDRDVLIELLRMHDIHTVKKITQDCVAIGEPTTDDELAFAGYNILCISLMWFIQSLRAGYEQPKELFTLFSIKQRPMAGAVITIAEGFNQRDKNTMSDVAVLSGATFRPDLLLPTTTHLMVPSSYRLTDEKVIAATTSMDIRGIQLVAADFLLAQARTQGHDFDTNTKLYSFMDPIPGFDHGGTIQEYALNRLHFHSQALRIQLPNIVHGNVTPLHHHTWCDNCHSYGPVVSCGQYKCCIACSKSSKSGFLCAQCGVEEEDPARYKRIDGKSLCSTCTGPYLAARARRSQALSTTNSDPLADPSTNSLELKRANTSISIL